MPDPREARVAVQGLGKRYRGRMVVGGVSLSLRSGDMIALVGANGGGKTTTLRMLAGLLAPDTGTGHVLGRDIRSAGTARRGSIGYMTQRVGLYPELDIRANLSFRAAIQRIADPQEAVARAIDLYGLAAYAGTRIEHLSGGWARRAHFAATMLHEPELVLLDEPTAGLDTETKRLLWSWLETAAAAGRIVVIVTHDDAEIDRCCAVMRYEAGIAGTMS